MFVDRSLRRVYTWRIVATKTRLFVTCLGDNFFPGVLRDMLSVLQRVGVECSVPQGQVCCGQPLYNSGFHRGALAPARQWLRVFGHNDAYILAPSGSCTDFVRHRYPELFPAGSAEHEMAESAAGRIFEFSEFLTRVLGVSDVGARFPRRVTYHASCHILRGLNLREEPKQLLRSVRDLRLVPLPEEETCCGFGGVFSLVAPEVSKAMMDAKVRNIVSTGAEVVVVGEPGCLMNIAGGLRGLGSPVRAMHLAEILASE
jgi:L-lactate dehydrogenase complex protein LldE